MGNISDHTFLEVAIFLNYFLKWKSISSHLLLLLQNNNCNSFSLCHWFCKQSFEPLGKVSWKLLTFKTVFLLTLASVKGRSGIYVGFFFLP